ncbi:MAG: NTP transferase domain-containing protein [Candidatus Omnitrophota bacterium]|nr:MAG: NTP transferase domain-containing protein [Candidatus Omnitrophota bacterium]
MKGVILAGGLGKRLYPLTAAMNKHLLNIYNKPMVYYPIQTLVDAGIREILLVTGGNNAGDFLRLLGIGKEFGLKHIEYTYQRGEGGIADALRLAEDFADGGKIVVILGDNIIEKPIKKYVQKFVKQKQGARLLIKKVPDPERFGVVEFGDSKILKITEKPKKPKTDYIVTGIYMYDAKVFDIIKTLKPSKRGELEITDVNNRYIKRCQLYYDILPGFWTDSGTFDSLLRANNLVARRMARQ